METKTLYQVIWVRDGQHTLLQTFNEDWMEELRAQSYNEVVPSEFPGMDREGFGWWEMKIPIDVTLEDLDIIVDANTLYPLV